MNRNTIFYTSRRRRQIGYNYGRNQNLSAFESTIKLGPITSSLMIGLMVTVLGLIYLTQATRVTSYDYKMSQVDAQIAKLNARKTDLEIEQARLASIRTLTASTVAQNMTNADSVSFIKN